MLLTAVSHALAHVTLRHQIEQRLRVATADRAQMVRLYVDQQHERMRLVTSRTRLRQLLILQRQKQILQPAFREETQQILQDVLGRSHGFGEIWIADMQGTVIAGTSPGDWTPTWHRTPISSAACWSRIWANRCTARATTAPSDRAHRRTQQ